MAVESLDAQVDFAAFGEQRERPPDLFKTWSGDQRGVVEQLVIWPARKSNSHALAIATAAYGPSNVERAHSAASHRVAPDAPSDR